jgi:fatty acid/phospholipid biosynthesis enzyme
MICHGSSNPTAIMNAIKMAHDSETHQVNRKLTERLEEISAEGHGETNDTDLLAQPNS